MKLPPPQMALSQMALPQMALAIASLAATAAHAGCAGAIPPLPGTGLCQEAALALIPPARLQTQNLDIDGCTYVIGETMTPTENEAILYRALQCNGRTTALEFSAGAQSAALGYGVSGFFDDVPTNGDEAWELVRIFSLDGVADPKTMIADMARQTTQNPDEAAACDLRPAGNGFPADAFVVDVSDAYQQAGKIGPYDPATDSPDAGVYTACGIWGITDAYDFWLIRDGYAWFITQGQDLPDFDAASLTIIRKGQDGQWQAPF